MLPRNILIDRYMYLPSVFFFPLRFLGFLSPVTGDSPADEGGGISTGVGSGGVAVAGGEEGGGGREGGMEGGEGGRGEEEGGGREGGGTEGGRGGKVE